MVLFLLMCAITWLSLNRWVVLDGCNPSGSAVDAGLDAAARALRAEHAADGGVVYGQQALYMSSSAPLIHAQRVLPNLTTIVPTTACCQRNYVETYSRYRGSEILPFSLTRAWL